MISIRHLTRSYGPVVAVDDVSLDIQRGEVVGLLGHNGAGKTTLMKVLTGYLEASTGSVTVAGKDVAEDRKAVQRLIGYLPENAPIYPEMAVQHYLQMMAELRQVPADRVDAAVLEAARSTGLTTHLETPIHTLSKGYRQRVGLAQAIVHKPEVLVLDEPTNGLDPVQIRSIRELILRLAKNTTIILSTHILQEIEAVCDRVLVIIEGALAADGQLSDLLATQEYEVSVDAHGASDSDVQARLCAVPGIQSAARTGDDPDNAGFGAWRLGCMTGTTPVPSLIDEAGRVGWAVASAGPKRRTLESFFEALHDEHIAARSAGGAGSDGAAR
jgi:ABC-2 type transport system ATP-binding protein